MVHPESQRQTPHRDASRSTLSLRSRALAEGKHFVALFIYLWVLFGLFVLNERVILHQHGIDFAAHGFAIFNAFILAKVMLIIDHFNFSHWLRRRPLIFPILHDSLVFSLLFILFHMIEMIVVNAVKGQGAAEGIPNIGGGGIGGVVCVAVILFFALIPFFAFRNLNRAVGRERINAMLFKSPTAMLDDVE